MKIRFMLFKIKETGLLFREEKITKEYSYSKIATETRKRETFSEEYSKRVLNDAIATVQTGAKMKYLGYPNRVSKEEFEVTINQNIYNVDFIIDTMPDGEVQLEIAISDQLNSGISTSTNVEYDNCLERLKIKLKDRLMLDWSTCIWIYDEQSESLCSSLYPQIFQIENKVREFSNRALVKSLGPDWVSRWGLEEYKKSVDRLSTYFEQCVPEFRDIDSTMFSMTLSTGEKQIVFRGAHLLKNMQSIEGGTVMVDEPELSMHPKWQDKCLQYYRDIFKTPEGEQTVQIFFATHSEYVIRAALEDQDDVLIIVLKNKDGEIHADPVTAPMALESITAAEINYLAFDMVSPDYHNQLYGCLQNKTERNSIRDCDNYILQAEIYDSSLHKKPYVYTDSNGHQVKYTTLPTYIRNAIDHPNPSVQYTQKELRDSIELLIKLCNAIA